MTLEGSMLYAMILACEAGFWVVLCSGLAFRYVFRQSRVSWLCLLSLPLIDIALLGFTVLDLRRGASATMAHGLATAYIGFTVAFGSIVIGWADRKFAERFGGAPPRAPLPLSGWAEVRHEVELWGRCLLAVAIIYVMLFGMIKSLGRPEQTKELESWYGTAAGIAFLWFLGGPLWSLVFCKRKAVDEDSQG